MFRCPARVINRSWTFLFWVSDPKVLIALGVLVFLVYCYDHNNATRNNYANNNATLMIDFSAGLDDIQLSQQKYKLWSVYVFNS